MLKIDINENDYLRKNWFRITEILKSSINLIESYKNVFNDSVWESWVKCKEGCWFRTTFEKSPIYCPNCNWDIINFYSDEKIDNWINFFLKKDFYKAFQIVGEENNVYGFIWWFWDNLYKLNEYKLKLDKSSFISLERKLIDLWFILNKDIFYLSEIWVVKDVRWNWLWKFLLEVLRNNVPKGMNFILQTSKKSPMYWIVKSIWFKEVFTYKQTNIWKVTMAWINI